MTTSIGALQVDLRLATAKFEQGMARANKSLSSMQKTTQTLSRGMQGLLAIGAGSLFGSVIKSSLDAADALAKSSVRLGVSAERLQELQFAASQSGIAVNTLEMGLQRFGRRMAEAANGTGEAKAALATLGIATRNADGSIRDVNSAFTEAINKLGQMENAAERNALAMKLFDSEGVRLVQFGSNLDNLTKKARDLGLVISGDVLKNAEATNDQFDVLSRTIGAQFTRAIVNIAPLLSKMGNEMVEFTGQLNQFFQTFRQDMDLVGQVAIGNRLNDLLGQQLEIENNLKRAQAAANMGGALGQAANSEEIERLQAKFDEISARIENLKDRYDSHKTSVEKSTDAVERFTSSIQSATAGQSDLYKKLFGDPDKKKGREVVSHQFNNYAKAAMERINEGNGAAFKQMMERAQDVMDRSSRSDLNFDVEGMRDVMAKLSQLGQNLPAAMGQGSGSLTMGGKTYGPQKPVASFEFVIDGKAVQFSGPQDEAAAFASKMAAAIRGEASAFQVSKL